MKHYVASRAAVFARTGLTLAAFALLGCAADDLSNPPRGSSSARTMPATNVALGQSECAGEAPLHVLHLQDPDGGTLELVFCRGVGWKQVRDHESAQSVALRKTSFSPVAVSQAETSSASASDPMAVFIDGPTGYAFAWTAEAGWTFMGSMVGETH